MFVNYKAENEETADSQYQKVIRLKKDKLCEDLLQYLRANLLFSSKSPNRSKLLASAPVDIEFELFILSCALNLMKSMLNNKYPTSLEQDKTMLGKVQDNYRFKMALVHRINQKEILAGQINLLGLLLRILARVKECATLKEAYSMRVNELESEQEVVMNRIRVRKYLRELQYYHSTLLNIKL